VSANESTTGKFPKRWSGTADPRRTGAPDFNLPRPSDFI